MHMRIYIYIYLTTFFLILLLLWLVLRKIKYPKTHSVKYYLFFFIRTLLDFYRFKIILYKRILLSIKIYTYR